MKNVSYLITSRFEALIKRYESKTYRSHQAVASFMVLESRVFIRALNRMV
ncbi:MAG: hypothetical protein H6Q75_1404 [Firmicutes bacterium]|nr:hypothetical protein [Bacillota bacterium]